MEGFLPGSVGAGFVFSGGYESVIYTHISLRLVPRFPLGAHVFSMLQCSTKPLNKADEFFQKVSVSKCFPDGGFQKKETVQKQI